MKGLNTVVLCLCLWFCACTDRNAVPSGIIRPDSMQVILKDVITADHFASEYVLKDSLRKDSVRRNVKLEARQLYETVFALHKITRDEFRKSMDFYYSRPDMLKNMFDSLSAYESRHRNDLYKPRNTPVPYPGDTVKTLGPHLKDSVKSVVAHLRDSLKLIGPHPKDSVKKVIQH